MVNPTYLQLETLVTQISLRFQLEDSKRLFIYIYYLTQCRDDVSDNDGVEQSNDQKIDDVKKGSSAENRAENSVSFDDSDSPPPDCQIC